MSSFFIALGGASLTKQAPRQVLGLGGPCLNNGPYSIGCAVSEPSSMRALALYHKRLPNKCLNQQLCLCHCASQARCEWLCWIMNLQVGAIVGYNLAHVILCLMKGRNAMPMVYDGAFSGIIGRQRER